jgi:uncharacterized protein YpmB
MQMKKPFWIILIIFILITVVFTGMFSYSNKDSSAKNGFNRALILSDLQLTAKTILDPDTYSIVGLNDDQIILSSATPHKVVFLPYDLKSSIKKTLSFPISKDSTTGVNSLKFYKKNIYLLNGRTAMIYEIDSNNKRINSNKLDSIPFNHAAIINENSFVITRKITRNKENNRALKKVNWNGEEQGVYFPEKQIDGFFDNDGQFKYDEKTKRLIYMFFYRGEFACLDTNLNQLYKAKTIDTVRYSNTEVVTNKVEIHGNVLEKVTLSKPPRRINRRVCMADNYVYINSDNLIALK